MGRMKGCAAAENEALVAELRLQNKGQAEMARSLPEYPAAKNATAKAMSGKAAKSAGPKQDRMRGGLMIGMLVGM